MAGSKKRWRELLLEFQAWTQAWLLSHAAICSAVLMPATVMTPPRPQVDALSVDGLGGSRYLEFSALSREDHIVHLDRKETPAGAPSGMEMTRVPSPGEVTSGIEFDTLETGKDP